MPREFLEHGGSEDPAQERCLAETLRQDQENGVRAETAIESPILVNALDLLGKTGFPLDCVALKVGCEDSVAHTILDEARSGGYATIVVSRHDSNGLNRLMHAEGPQASCSETHPASRCGLWNERELQPGRPLNF